MNYFKQHIPNFVDMDKRPEWIPFATTEELLNLEVVKRYGRKKNFSHFAMSDNYLMVIADEGFIWRVVGRIKNPDEVDLPQWEGWKFRAEMPSGEQVILGDEVVVSCGDTLTLRDGTKARNLNYP